MRNSAALLAALGAAALAFTVIGGVDDKSPMRDLSNAPWLAALLAAFSFGTFLVPFGLADINEPVPKTLRMWGLMLIVAAVVWLAPLILAPYFKWSFDDCISISICFVLLPALLEPLTMWKQRRKAAEAEGSA